MIINEVHGYSVSKDYSLLYEMAKCESIICLVDYYVNCRDIGHTIYDTVSGSIQVSARGISYIWADNLEQFITQCQAMNLEFIIPETSYA